MTSRFRAARPPTGVVSGQTGGRKPTMRLGDRPHAPGACRHRRPRVRAHTNASERSVIGRRAVGPSIGVRRSNLGMTVTLMKQVTSNTPRNTSVVKSRKPSSGRRNGAGPEARVARQGPAREGSIKQGVHAYSTWQIC